MQARLLKQSVATSMIDVKPISKHSKLYNNNKKTNSFSFFKSKFHTHSEEIFSDVDKMTVAYAQVQKWNCKVHRSKVLQTIRNTFVFGHVIQKKMATLHYMRRKYYEIMTKLHNLFVMQLNKFVNMNLKLQYA